MLFAASIRYCLRLTGKRFSSILLGQKLPAIVSKCGLRKIGWKSVRKYDCTGGDQGPEMSSRHIRTSSCCSSPVTLANLSPT